MPTFNILFFQTIFKAMLVYDVMFHRKNYFQMKWKNEKILSIFGLFGLYGISTFVSYLMPNPLLYK